MPTESSNDKHLIRFYIMNLIPCCFRPVHWSSQLPSKFDPVVPDACATFRSSLRMQRVRDDADLNHKGRFDIFRDLVIVDSHVVYCLMALGYFVGMRGSQNLAGHSTGGTCPGTCSCDVATLGLTMFRWPSRWPGHTGRSDPGLLRTALAVLNHLLLRRWQLS